MLVGRRGIMHRPQGTTMEKKPHRDWKIYCRKHVMTLAQRLLVSNFSVHAVKGYLQSHLQRICTSQWHEFSSTVNSFWIRVRLLRAGTVSEIHSKNTISFSSWRSQVRSTYHLTVNGAQSMVYRPPVVVTSLQHWPCHQASGLSSLLSYY